jgi:protein-S-isoprenylcysteine O-methyltransferase Ste14
MEGGFFGSLYNNGMKKFLAKHGIVIVRDYIKKDIIYFLIPWITVFTLGIALSGREIGLTLRNNIINPQNLLMLSVQSIVGLILFVTGLSIMIIGQVTLRKSYSSTLIIKKGQKLRTHGIYRFTRNPIYFGFILVAIGIPTFTSSLYGLLVMLLEIPICLSRIRIEQRMLIEHFGDEYRRYMKTTKKLFPFIY